MDNHKKGDTLLCPACGEVHTLRSDADFATSRYRDIKICPPCGTREAFEGDFWGHNLPSNIGRH